MSKKIVTIVLFLIVPVLVSAQNVKRELIPSAPVVVEESSITSNTNFNPVKVQADGNYIPIDTMSNAFGPAIGVLNPFAFDPYSGVLAFVHRGWAGKYATGSGQIWYNISTDFGVTWSRVPGGVNTTNSQIAGRYPSMSISNPGKGPIANTIAFFSWPELVGSPASFGGVGYAADQPAGAGAGAAFLDMGANPNLYSSQAPCWTSDITSEMFWTANYNNSTARQPGGAGIDLWRTTDFGSVSKTSPAQWSDTVLNSGGNIMLGGEAWKGVQYFGILGTFNPYYWINPTQMRSGWYPAYSKSTDNGETWSNFKIADFRDIPKLAGYTRLFDYKKGDTYVSYQGDIHVDKNGHVHLLIQVADTISSDTDNKAALVDVFETATGWDATIVTEDLDVSGNVWLYGPGLGQMGPSSYLAFDSTRSVMVAQWVNTGAGGWADVYMSHKLLTDTVWSTPVNLTNSATINNTQSHLAPFIRIKNTSGNTYECSAFSMYGYVAGDNLPYGDTTLPTVIYTAVEKFNVNIITGINDPINSVKSFALSQNYPNPFNPSTKIDYSLSSNSNVSLKVYDLLGREVANLVNATQEAGNHSVNFNASNLASGLYIYTLKSGNSVTSRKMMLLK